MKEQFSIRTRVFVDDHSMKILAETKGTRALIISDKVMEQLGYLGQAVGFLREAGLTVTTFTDVTSEPSMEIVTAAMEALLTSEADVVVALGGGSVIDTAKGTLYIMRQFIENKGAKFIKPCFIAIPSTSGTGSEVTDFSVITVNGTKLVIVDEGVAPDATILDSTCIQNVPRQVIADTGLDVLVHGIEAFVSKKSTDFTDALAEKAVRLIFQYLEKMYLDPSDTDARDHIQNASCMAGMAFTNSNLGITHSLAHALGGTFNLSHGHACALLAEHVIRYNAKLDGKADNEACRRYALLASALGLPAATPRGGAVSLIMELCRLKEKLNIESGIHLLEKVNPDVFEKSLDSMADTAMRDRCTTTNPRIPTKEDLIAIYRKSY